MIMCIYIRCSSANCVHSLARVRAALLSCITSVLVSVTLHVYSPSSSSAVELICRLPLVRKVWRESDVMTAPSRSQEREAGGEVVVNVQSKRTLESVAVRTSFGSTSNTVTERDKGWIYLVLYL